MRDLGIGSWPRRRLKSAPSRTAFVFGGRTDTYADVEARTRRLANALRAGGVGPGDRVAYVGFNHPALLETFFATARLGAIWVVVNPRLAADEVGFVLRDSGASVVVHGPEHARTAAFLAPSGGVRTWVAVEADRDGPDAPAGPGTPAAPGPLAYESFLAGGADDDIDEPVTWDDPALIMYTSGTTGRPKGAVHTHGSLSFQYFTALVDHDLTCDEVTLAVAPMFHIAGLNTQVMPTFLKGGRILVHDRFRPADVLRAIDTDRVTSLFVVPVMLDALSQHPDWDSTDLSSLRNVLVGGAPVPDHSLRTWSGRGVPVQQGFGMTETAPGIFVLPPGDAFRKPGSAGRSHWWVEGRVVRPDGSAVAPGQIGEVVAQGPNLMAGYWNRPGATAEAIVDGWFRTGDLATVDEEGYVFVKDRLKDMFISGGENVYPAEVENALLEVPGVADAAVVGVPDARWGEVGRAFLVPAPGAHLDPAAVTAALDGHLARYKIPRHVTVVSSLPRTATGKLQRHRLAQNHLANTDLAHTDLAHNDRETP